jgi:hypothetical protein
MKWVMALVMAAAGAAWGQYQPQVKTTGAVVSNEVAVFADGSGRLIRGGGYTMTNAVTRAVLTATGALWRAEWQAADTVVSNGAASMLASSGSLWRTEWQAADTVVSNGAAAMLASSGSLWRTEWRGYTDGATNALRIEVAGWTNTLTIAQTNEAALRAAGDTAGSNYADQVGVAATNAVAVALPTWETDPRFVAWTNINDHLALGSGSSATGEPGALAMGPACQANGSRSVALGLQAVADGTTSLALGYDAQVSGFRSVQIGHSSNVLTDESSLRFRDTMIVLSNTLAETDPQAILTNGTRRMPVALLSDREQLTTAPVDDEFATAEWVRSLAMSGAEWFYTATGTNGYGEKTTNFAVLSLSPPASAFTNSIASPVPSSTYIAGGVGTQLYGAVRSPITFEVWCNRVGGNSSTVIPAHPEIYYVYAGTTNHLGDYDSGDQNIAASATAAKYTWTVSFVEPTITSGVYVIGYLKSGTVSGTAAGVNILGGGVYDSHMNIDAVEEGDTAEAVQANLTTHTNTALAGGAHGGELDSVYGAWKTNVASGGFLSAQWEAVYTNQSSTNVTLSPVNGWLQELTVTNATTVLNVADGSTNLTQGFRLELIPGTNTVLWAAGISNAANVTIPFGVTTAILCDRPKLRPFWWVLKLGGN